MMSSGAELLPQNVEEPTQLVLPPRGFARPRSPTFVLAILPLATIKNHSLPVISLKSLHNKDMSVFKSFHFPVSAFMGDQAGTRLFTHEQAFGV